MYLKLVISVNPTRKCKTKEIKSNNKEHSGQDHEVLSLS